MRKVTQKHATAINTIMLKTIKDYLVCFASDPKDADNFSMYADDVAYNAAALAKFNENRNAAMLHDTVLMQDTIVREYFIDVLQYLENNKLVPSNQFACA